MPSSSCIVLVPFHDRIEPRCEAGLSALERSGIAVRRVEGISEIGFGRSVMASDALREGYEEIMWIDSDIGFEPADVQRLRDHQLPFVCGIYPKKGLKEFACEFLPNTRSIVFGKQGGLHPIRYAGLGFTLVRRKVFDLMREKLHLAVCNRTGKRPIVPFFLPLIHFDEALNDHFYLPEDFAFCERVRQIDVEIVADTAIRLSHIGKFDFTWDCL